MTTVTAGRDGTKAVQKVPPCHPADRFPPVVIYRHVPPAKSLQLEITVPARRNVEQVSSCFGVTPKRYRSVQPRDKTITVPFHRENEMWPSRPAVTPKNHSIADQISWFEKYRTVLSWGGLRWTYLACSTARYNRCPSFLSIITSNYGINKYKRPVLKFSTSFPIQIHVFIIRAQLPYYSEWKTHIIVLSVGALRSFPNWVRILVSTTMVPGTQQTSRSHSSWRVFIFLIYTSTQ